MVRTATAFSLLIITSAPGVAQSPFAGVRPAFIDEAPTAYVRSQSLQDNSALRPVLWRASKTDGGKGIRLEPARLRTEANSGYVVDRNNGSLWGGRGINTQLHAGLGFYSTHFSVGLRPEINFQQNQGLRTRVAAGGRSAFANGFYGNLDLPQRFGPDAYTTLAPGQSFVRGDVSALGAGFSTENLWWGPGLRESLVLSNTARGFPHGFLESNRPVDIGLGRLSASAFWGKLGESAYFDTIASNDHRLLTGLGVTFQPQGLENLTLGFTRIFAYAWDSLSVRHFIPFGEPVLKQSLETPDNPKGNNSDDQRLSVFFVYSIPSAGFEVYGEFGREDHSYDFRDLIGEPEHSAAHLIGFQSIRSLAPGKSVRVQGEWVNLQNLRAGAPARSPGVYYVHRPQGHTEGGQMLGAGIGPGAESQFLSIDILSDRGSTGGFIERVRRNELAAPAQASRQGWPPLHDLELTGGVRGSRAVGHIDIMAQLSYSYRMQRDFIEDDTNVRAVLQAEWRPRPEE